MIFGVKISPSSFFATNGDFGGRKFPACQPVHRGLSAQNSPEREANLSVRCAAGRRNPKHLVLSFEEILLEQTRVNEIDEKQKGSDT